MNCNHVEELISRYLENDLDTAETSAFQAHIQTCPSCRGLLERMEKVVFMCGELSEEVPFFLRNRLYNIIESQPEEVPAIPAPAVRLFKWAAAAAGTVILLLNLLYFTSLVPPANRFLHMAVSRIQTLAVETGAYLERVSESERNSFLGVFRSEDRDPGVARSAPERENGEGGKNG